MKPNLETRQQEMRLRQIPNAGRRRERRLLRPRTVPDLALVLTMLARVMQLTLSATEKSGKPARLTWRKIQTALAHKYLLKKRGLTPAQYDVILQKQGGGCAGCGKPPGDKRLALDHDHLTDENRGLLCDLCNRTVGCVHDDPATLRRLADYLERYSSATRNTLAQ